MNEQLNIVNLIDMLLRRWTIVIISAVIVGIFSFVYSEVFIAPVYRSSASLYVKSSNYVGDEVSTATMNSSRQLVTTYAEILKGRTFLSKVSDDLNNKYSISQIKSMISMQSLNDTEILSISVQGTDSSDVYAITKALVKYAPDELIRVVEAGSVKVLDNASETNTPISPNIRNNTFIGVFIGLILGAFIVIILELFDTRIKGGDEINRRYKEPLLGEIPSLAATSSHSDNSSGTNTNKQTSGGARR